MQIFKLPESTLKKIDNISRDFLWGSMVSNKKMRNVNWKTVCKPLDQRGLGLPSAKYRNLSLLIILAWRSQTSCQGSLWTKLIFNKYQNKSLSNSSLIWKSLSIRWKFCNKWISYLLGNGEKISFWDDNWCLDPPLRSLTQGPLHEHVDTAYSISSAFSHNWCYFQYYYSPLFTRRKNDPGTYLLRKIQYKIGLTIT